MANKFSDFSISMNPLVKLLMGVAPALVTIGGVINEVGGECPLVDSDLLVVPARVVDLGLTFPLATPFYIAPVVAAP
jgi:hypothetical protein